MKKTQYNNLFNSNSNTTLFIWFLFFLTIFLTLIPFFKIGLTNCDDIEYYLKSFWNESNRIAYAHGAGRFYFLITKPVYNVPYLIDNFYFTKIIQYICVLLSFSLFAVVVKKIFKQHVFALSVFLLLFVFLTVTPNYFMPIIAFPLYFTLSFSIFLLSLISFIKYYETTKYKYFIFSVILFAIAFLFYETYLIFLLYLILFIIGKNISEQGIRIINNKKFYKEFLPFMCTGIAYVVIYYLYRMSVRTGDNFYLGSSVAENFSFFNFLKIIWNFNRAAFPTYVYHRFQDCMDANSLLVTGHLNNFWYILKNSNSIIVINALIQCFLFYILSCRIKPDISWKKIRLGALISFTFIFSVHFILGVSEKYNAIYYNMSGYVTTYYSYFCITFFIALLVFSCIKLGYKNKYVKATVITVFSLLIFWVSIIIGYNNDHLSRDWQLNHGKHAMMEKVIEEGIFDIISDDAIVYMDNYNQTVSKLGKNTYSIHSAGFWASYIHVKTNRKLNVLCDYESLKKTIQTNSEQEVYFITKYETQKSQDILLIMSKINVNSIDFENKETAFTAATANEVVVYYYSVNKDFIFYFIIPQYFSESTVRINNIEMQNVTSGINAVRIENTNKKKAITSFTLQSSDQFFIKGFAISNIGFMNEEIFYLYDY